eukprot:TRINITY_DN4590_c0_g1_i3.p1 TRINITY_DN4590_c0_g1~~TRINITY_DN4590_c0_g1_i3.p1  ORF type:complete len:205 (-),score=89.52 TRINITY_DN4590_c0_g1_i3:27-641(-)
MILFILIEDGLIGNSQQQSIIEKEKKEYVIIDLYLQQQDNQLESIKIEKKVRGMIVTVMEDVLKLKEENILFIIQQPSFNHSLSSSNYLSNGKRQKLNNNNHKEESDEEEAEASDSNEEDEENGQMDGEDEEETHQLLKEREMEVLAKRLQEESKNRRKSSEGENKKQRTEEFDYHISKNPSSKSSTEAKQSKGKRKSFPTKLN